MPDNLTDLLLYCALAGFLFLIRDDIAAGCTSLLAKVA